MRSISAYPVRMVDGLAATHLYRICQEAANNAIRHGGARNLDIRLENMSGEVILTVEDDGSGLPSHRTAQEGMGLNVMKYRSDTIGAAFQIGARPGGGAVATCRLPHSAAPKDQEP